MIKYAEAVRKLGCCVAVPCNDLVHGLITGTHKYNDYFDNNVEILKRCDAITLTPGWITSEGTKKEIEIANYHDIPVLKNLTEVEMFLEEKVKVKPVGDASGTIHVEKQMSDVKK